MKIAIDVSPLATGHSVRGIGSYTANLVEQFKRQDWGVEFIFFENPNSPPPETDIIHHPYFDIFFKTLPSKKNSGRVVVTIHDVIPLVFPDHFPVGPKGFINLFFQKRALATVDAVVCDSETSKKDICDKLSYPAEKIQVIYLAAGPNFKKLKSPNMLSKVAQKYHLPKEFIVYVGDVNWNKNLEGLVEAIKISRVNLVMVGSAICDKNLIQTQNIDKLIKKLNLQKQIIKTGYLPEIDLIAIYNLADLTVLPSFYEGFGLPVLESMACGTPVVCSKVASLAEIADNAIFCNPSDPQDIAKSINFVLNLPKKEREILSQKSILSAAKFSWRKVAKQTIDVYQKVHQM